jgi:hypothetical protein
MSYKNNKAPLADIMALMPESERIILTSFIERTKMNPRWYATNSFKTAYKSKIVYRFRINEKGWQINLTLAAPANLDEALADLSDEEQAFYFKNLRKCNHCNPNHGKGKRFVILGKEYFGCAEPEVEIKNPTAQDIDMLCKFVDMRKQNILNMAK